MRHATDGMGPIPDHDNRGRERRRKRFNSAGKVILAAIVHHGTISATCHDSSACLEDDANGASSSSKNQQVMTAHQEPLSGRRKGWLLGGKDKKQKNQETSGCGHDNDDDKNLSSKFSKFLFHSKRKQQPTTRETNSNSNSKPTTLIDNANCEYLVQPPKCLGGHNGGELHLLNQTPLRHANVGQTNNHTTATSSDIAASSNTRTPSEQVIEFKFDLIVDQEDDEDEDGEAMMWNSPSSGKLADTHDTMARRRQWPAEQEEEMMMKHKLNDNVNELVESFVLDSNDVCLMSMGEQRQQQVDLNKQPTDGFEYLNKLAMHTLAYSFKLLQSQSAGRRQASSSDGQKQSCPSDVELMSLSESSMASGEQQRRHPKGSIADLATNTYSIELSATLFLAGSSSESPHRSGRDGLDPPPSDAGDTGGSRPPTHRPGGFSIVDLLADNSSNNGSCCEPSQTEDHGANNARGPSVSIDCQTVGQALATIRMVRDELARLRQPNEFHELHSIFESIFNGQALAHLRKRQRVLQLQTSLENDDDDPRSSDYDHDGSIDDQPTTKQHHQVASQKNKLLQAEWLLYKQLSSALIRTLLIVHVHKLVNLSGSPQANGSIESSSDHQQQEEGMNITNYKKRLMEDNLRLLEFARSIQRASCIRLKRRKRHLRSHLASSNVSINSNISATTATNEILSSPLRLTSNSNKHHHHHHHHNYSSIYRHHPHAKEPPFLGATSCRKASLDMNLALARHHHRHHNNGGGGGGGSSSSSTRHQTHRFHTLQRQSDFTESSSISTNSTSGDQRTTQQMSSRARSSRSANRKAGYKQPDNWRSNNLSSTLNNFSDSDSVTSANLNSCSSSSYNRCHAAIPKPRSRTSRSRNGGISLEDPRWLKRQTGSSRRTTTIMMQQQQQQKRDLHGTLELSDLSGSPGTPIELSSMKCSASPKRRASSICRGGMDEKSMASRASSVIQIDCHPKAAANHRASSDLLASPCGGPETGGCYKTLTLQQLNKRAIDTDRQSMEDNNNTDFDFDANDADDVSVICSVIAEPPKQLKLEEFMSQLSSIIAPIATSGLMADRNCGIQKTEAEVDEEEEEEEAKRIDPLSRRRIEIGAKGGHRRDAEEEMILCPNGYDDRHETMMMAMMRKNASRQQDYCLASADDGQGQVAGGNPLTTESLIRSNGNCVTAAEEDDEDCKSHSSILEHLSSLALESNTKFNNRHLQQLHPKDYPFHHHHNNDQQRQTIYPSFTTVDHHLHHPGGILLQSSDSYLSHSFLLEDTAEPELNAAGQGHGLADKSPTGHLQRLLNSSSQFRKTSNSRVTVRDPSSIEDQLRALSIGCQVANLDSTSPSSGAFVSSSSNESSCSSSSNSGPVSSTSGDKFTDIRGSAAMSSQRDLYASVTRNQNVKT